MNKHPRPSPVITTLRFLNTRLEKLAFHHIFLVWISVIILFGFSYALFSTSSSYLLDIRTTTPIHDIEDAIYFSFIASSTTGFGDIAPLGFFRFIAIIEVMLGLLLLALVTSKLVSIKQDAILDELYELSFNENISKLRSSFLLFRQNIDKLLGKIEDGVFRKRDITDATVQFSHFEYTLIETSKIIGRSEHHHFVKNVDTVNTELIINSILTSLEKLHEFITLSDQHTIPWKTDFTTSLLTNCLSSTETIFSKLVASHQLPPEKITDLTTHKQVILSSLKTKLDPERI